MPNSSVVPMYCPPFNAADHSNRKSPGIMVAALAFFAERRASELTAPDHQGVLQRPASFEIGQQAGDWLIRSATPL
jgi:hypothetical protein